MISSREKLGLLLGFFGMCLFAGTLPATRLGVSGFDPLFLTAARVTLDSAAAAFRKLHNIDGLLSQTATEIRDALLHVISRLEAALDFSEEGYEFISREDARMHLQTVDLKHLSDYKVWLERDGKRVIEPAGTIPGNC